MTRRWQHNLLRICCKSAVVLLIVAFLVLATIKIVRHERSTTVNFMPPDRILPSPKTVLIPYADCRQPQRVGDYVYVIVRRAFETSETLRRFDIDSGSETLVSDPPGPGSVDSFQVNGSWLLVQSDGRISVRSLRDGRAFNLRIGETKGSPQLNGDLAAWIEPGADGADRIMLTDLRSSVTSEVARTESLIRGYEGVTWSGDSLVWTESRQADGVYSVFDTRTRIRTDHVLTSGIRRIPLLARMTGNRIFSINVASVDDGEPGDQRFGYLEVGTNHFTRVTRTDGISSSPQVVNWVQVTDGFVFWIDVSRTLWFAPVQDADKHHAINYALMDSFVELTPSSDGTLIATQRSGTRGPCTLSLITIGMLEERAELSSDWEYPE